jgi:hypothetical protein
MGEKITLVDYSAYGHLGNIQSAPQLPPELVQMIKKHEHLVRYVERLRIEFK